MTQTIEGVLNVDLCDFDSLTRHFRKSGPAPSCILRELQRPLTATSARSIRRMSSEQPTYSRALAAAKSRTAGSLLSPAARRFMRRQRRRAAYRRLSARAENALRREQARRGGYRRESIPAIFRLSSLGRSTIPARVSHRAFSFRKLSSTTRKRRSEIRFGNLDLFRDFSDIGRVVEAYSRLVSEPIDPTPVNICSGRFRPFDRYFENHGRNFGPQPQSRDGSVAFSRR